MEEISVGKQAKAQDERIDLVVTRRIEAPVEQVWRAWVEPELVKQWWGPDGFSAPLAEIDFKVGGTSLVCMSHPQFGEHYSTWHYREIIPLERIEYIHNLADKEGKKIDPATVGMPADFPQDQRNAVELRSLGDGATELTVTEYDWPVGQMLEMSRMGLEQCLAKMAAVVEG
jgi:uncharacterized protein YndB with AHSA1/START domain